MRERLGALAAVIVIGAGVIGIAVVGAATKSDRLPLLTAPGGGIAETSLSRDSMLAPVAVEYRVQGNLVDPGTEAPAYSLDAEPSDGVVSRLAAALGMNGPVEASQNEFVVRDGTKGLHVARQPGLPWWYASEDYSHCLGDATVSSDGAVTGCQTTKGPIGSGAIEPGSVEPSSVEPGFVGSDQPEVSCVMPPCPEGQACIQVCPDPAPDQFIEPQRPADLPTRTEAEARGRTLLSTLGVDVTQLRVDDGFDRWVVIADRYLDGFRVMGFETSLGIGPKGVVTSGNGYLAEPTRLGLYPLVGIDAGVQRLRDRSFPSATDLGRPEPLIAPAADCPTEVACDMPVDCPPGACDIAPAPTEPVIRTITGVTIGLELSGSQLVPVYLFALDDGGLDSVIAVTDAFIDRSASRR